MSKPAKKPDSVMLVHRHLLYSQEGGEIFEWQEDIGPLVQIGRKVLEGGEKGQAETFGTPEVKRQRQNEYQKFIDALHRQHPDLSYNALTCAAGKQFGRTQRTIKKYTRNPKK